MRTLTADTLDELLEELPPGVAELRFEPTPAALLEEWRDESAAGTTWFEPIALALASEDQTCTGMLDRC